MRYFFLLIILSTCSSIFAQPPGIDDSIMLIKGKWKANPPFAGAYDPALKETDFSRIYLKTNAISAMILQTFPEVRGAEPSWYTSIVGKPYFKGGPSPYQYTCLFKYYYYNKPYKKLMTNGESGTGATAYVNSFWFLLQETGLIASIDGGQKNIYEVCNTNDEWKGYPVYRVNDRSYQNYKMILLTKNGRLPWKPVTQLQYLQAYRASRLRESKEATDQLDNGIAQARKDLEKMKADKYYSNDMIATGQKTLNIQLARREATINAITNLLEKDLKKVDDYINNTKTETLQQQAVVKPNKGHKIWNGFADPLDKNAQKIVYINEAYFNKTLPSWEPQFITLVWYWHNVNPAVHFKNVFEKNFPVNQLQEMITATSTRAVHLDLSD